MSRSFASGQIFGGERIRLLQALGRIEAHDFAAALAGAGSHVEYAVGGKHDLRLVLDHDERIARIAQPLHHADHAFHVARVQADRRLVEHEERVDERGAERGRQVDALDFAARERARLTVEREIAEAHLHEVGKPGADFLEQQIGRFIELRWQMQVIDELFRALDRQQHEVVHGKTRQRAQDFVVELHAVCLVTLRRRQHAIGV